MAQQTHKLLINAAEFPFSYFKTARSAIQNQDIGPRLPGFFAGSNANFDFGQPQLLFCENVLPTARGLGSPFQLPQPTAPAGAPVSNFDFAFVVPRDATLGGPAGYYTVMVTGQGDNYVFQHTTGKFIAKPVGAITSAFPPTHVEVGGRVFIGYPYQDVLEWNYTTGVMASAAIIYPSGVVATDIRGIGSAFGYLLLFTDDTIYWNSPLNLLDFADIDQGAGNQIPEELRGQIQCIHAISGGAIVYSTSSVIGIRATNNAAAPFIFRAVRNAVGVPTPNCVAASNTSDHYTYSFSAVQRVTLEGAESMFPALGEFLAGYNLMEVWNSTTKKVEATTFMADGVQVRLHSDRFLTFSIGSSPFFPSAASPYKLIFVYDLLHRRWGKLRYDHVAVVAIPNSGLNAGLWLVKADGSSVLVYPQGIPTSVGATAVASLFLFGHIQERHDRFITFHELIVDANEPDSFSTPPVPVVTLLGSQTGASRDATVTPMEEVSSEVMSRTYSSRVTAQNFDIAIEGVLSINTILAKVTKHGHR